MEVGNDIANNNKIRNNIIINIYLCCSCDWNSITKVLLLSMQKPISHWNKKKKMKKQEEEKKWTAAAATTKKTGKKSTTNKPSTENVNICKLDTSNSFIYQSLLKFCTVTALLKQNTFSHVHNTRRKTKKKKKKKHTQNEETFRTSSI